MTAMSLFSQLVINSLAAGAIYALVALGFNLMYDATKFFNLAHGALIPIGGYGTFFFARKLGWNLAVSILLGILIAGLIGYAIERWIYRPLRRRKASNLVLLIASLGIFTLVPSLLAILFTPQFQTFAKPGETSSVYQVGAGAISQVQIIMIVLGLLITGALYIVLQRTAFGKVARAISDDEEVAKIVGIDTDRAIGWIFTLAAGLAGLAGILVGFDTGIEPAMGLSLLMGGIIAAVIGGFGNIYAGLVGAYALGFIENFGVWKISGEWKATVALAVLFLFLIFRPRGLFQK